MSSSTSQALPTAFHHKQPFNPDGDVFSNAFTRSMKNQPLDRWDKFAREALQNSWDARRADNSEAGISFSLEFTEFTSGQVAVLRDHVFGGDFDGIESLAKLIHSGCVSALHVSDRGTNGLRGPTSASISKGEFKDFTSFVRNFGRSDSKKLAGGTFGVGKAVFFVASEVSTILIYTRTTDENGNSSHRFIAMANEDDYESSGIQYTGRHWWGIQAFGGTERSRIEFAEPFLDAEADRIARALGMDEGFTEERPTGTTICVLSPVSTSQSPEAGDALMSVLASALTRWAWPHMVQVENNLPPIDFVVTSRNQEIQIPNPSTDPAIGKLVTAYRVALAGRTNKRNDWDSTFFDRAAEVWSLSPARQLGCVGAVNLPSPVKAEDTVLREDISNHVALLRDPRMVVQYRRGPVQRSDEAYCAVFVADSDLDAVLARSEPEAHHEWNPLALQEEQALIRKFWGSGARANPVRVLLDKLDSLLYESGSQNNLGGDRKHYQSLTALSDRFGGLVSAAQSGDSPRIIPSKPAKNKPSTSAERPAREVAVSGLRLLEDGQVCTTFSISFSYPQRSDRWLVRIEPRIVLDDGSVAASNLTESFRELPTVLAVSGDFDVETLDLTDGCASFRLGNSPSESVKVDVRQPADMAITLDFRFEK